MGGKVSSAPAYFHLTRRRPLAPLELLGNVRLVEREDAYKLVALGEDVERLVVFLRANGQLVGADLRKENICLKSGFKT